MARNPLELYGRLLAAALDSTDTTVPGHLERQAVTAVRRHLRARPDAWPPALGALLADAGVGAGYVTRHLLSIARFAPDVRDALAAGLPLNVCRLVNGVKDPAVRKAVLEPLWRATRRAGDAVLLPRGLSQQVLRAARRARQQPGPPTNVEAQVTLAGWLPAAARPATMKRPPGNVWLYPNPTRAARQAESLPEVAVEALLALYLPAGGRLVDVTAGGGRIGMSASRHGVESWSGDVAPGAGFVHEADARWLLSDGHASLADTADMLVIHPPSYPAWLEALDDEEHATATVDGYTDLVGEMLGGSLGALGKDGVAVMITRPVRSQGRVWLVTSHVSQVMEESGLTLVGYHLAASRDGRDEWQLLVGRR